VDIYIFGYIFFKGYINDVSSKGDTPPFGPSPRKSMNADYYDYNIINRNYISMYDTIFHIVRIRLIRCKGDIDCLPPSDPPPRKSIKLDLDL